MRMSAKSPEDFPDLDQMRAMSGREFIEGVQAGRFPAAPIADTLDYDLEEVGDGRVVFAGTPGFRAYNPIGTVHGGWYGTLLDSAMACAVMTKVPKGSIYTTLEYKVNIVKGIPLDREIFCDGRVEHSGRSTGVANGWLRDAQTRRLYATGSTTCIIMEMK